MKTLLDDTPADSKRKNEKKSINEEMLREFVCNNIDDSIIKKLDRIDQRPINSTEFRINVWTQYKEEDRVVSSNKIVASFFVELLPNGEIIDRTKNA